jgi:hypothetical protein
MQCYLHAGYYGSVAEQFSPVSISALVLIASSCRDDVASEEPEPEFDEQDGEDGLRRPRRQAPKSSWGGGPCLKACRRSLAVLVARSHWG